MKRLVTERNIVNIRQVCRSVCSTQFELADVFGVSRTTFDNWQRGTRSPPALAVSLFEILRVLAQHEVMLPRRILALTRTRQLFEIVKLAMPFIDASTASSGGDGVAPTKARAVAGLPPLE
jgi:DNA-binding XRE family transcriptional regulator